MERRWSNRPAPCSARSSSATRRQTGPTLFQSTRISADTALLGACTLNHATCRSKSYVYALLRLAHGTIATVTPWAPQSTRGGAYSSRSFAQPMSSCRQRRAGRRSYGRPCPPHSAQRPVSLAYGRTGTTTTSPPRRSFSMRGAPVTTFAGRCSMRLSAPADMVGTGVPLFFGSILGGNKPNRRTPLSYPHTRKPRQRHRYSHPHHTNWRRL